MTTPILDPEVQRCLARQTDDGPGDLSDLPESDWRGFATVGVQVPHRMGATVAYDRPIRDFIAGLDATGHVTHTSYRKRSVTFHHNGGRLSLQGCLDVWTYREASAHFQSDGDGNLGQYVRVNEYAWAAGNTQGNIESIHIEMADETLAPEWRVGEATWQSAARLAGWLFARVIGAAPTRDTVHVHHDWKSTECAGPFIDRIREGLFQAVLAAYNQFANGTNPPPPPPPPPAGNVPILGPWPYSGRHHFGNILGDNYSHGGINALERQWVRNIQQHLIRKGCVPGQSNVNSGWADGKWENATDDAMIRWHNRFYPGQPKPAECWADDYARLAA